MNMDDDTGGDSAKKREPFKRKHRIKTSKTEEATEPAVAQIPTAITVTDTNDQEPQEKRRESIVQNNIQDGPTVDKPKEDNEDAKAEEKIEVNEEKKEEPKGAEENEKPEQPKEVTTKETETKTLAIEEVSSVPSIKIAPSPKKAPKFKQRAQKQFKSKPPKKGVLGFGDDIPGMDGLGTDITVICPWEAFSHLELHELAQFGII